MGQTVDPRDEHIQYFQLERVDAQDLLSGVFIFSGLNEANVCAFVSYEM